MVGWVVLIINTENGEIGKKYVRLKCTRVSTKNRKNIEIFKKKFITILLCGYCVKK